MGESLDEKFHRDGFLVGMDVLTQEEVDFYLQSFLKYEERLGGNVTGNYRYGVIRLSVNEVHAIAWTGTRIFFRRRGTILMFLPG